MRVSLNQRAASLRTLIVEFLREESGQDLIEYALVVALVAFAATAGMSSLATGINLAFSNVALTLNTTIT
jgi:pilus assembly protein Flp/PilA